LNTLLRQPYRVLVLLVMVFFSVLLHAQSAAETGDNDNNFLEFNFGVAAFESRYTDAPQKLGAFLNIYLNYQWHGFFFENKGGRSLGSPGAGYNFYNQGSWELDAYISQTHHGILTKFDETLGNEHDGLVGLSTRDEDVRLGLRVTHYLDNNSALRVLLAPFGNRGPFVGAWYGRTWQFHNYNFHAIAGAQYHAAETLDYYYGVQGNDISEKFPFFAPGSGITTSAEIGLTYPLAQDWLVDTSFKLTRLPNSIADSPLIERQVEAVAQVSLTYVVF